MRGVIDVRDREAEQDVDQDEEPELLHQHPALAIDRMMEPVRCEQQSEQAEDRARCTDGWRVTAEHEARDRAACGAKQIAEQEPRAAIPALADRAEHVTRI